MLCSSVPVAAVRKAVRTWVAQRQFGQSTTQYAGISGRQMWDLVQLGKRHRVLPSGQCPIPNEDGRSLSSTRADFEWNGGAETLSYARLHTN
jgi:hypothetical protein